MTNQSHSGSGDNVAGNKKVVNYVSLSSVWIATGVVLVGLTIWLVPKLIPEPVTLSGRVVSNADVPIDKAKVDVYIPGASEPITGYTDVNGNFLFEKIDVSEVRDFTIKAQFHERQQSIDFQEFDKESLPITVKMPAGIPPFAVKYLNLAGYEVDFLMFGKLNPKMAKAFGGRVTVVPNVVYETLKNLGDKFSRPLTMNPPLSYEDDPVNPQNINKRAWAEDPEFFAKKILGTNESHLESTEKDIRFDVDFLKLFPGWKMDGRTIQESDWAKMMANEEEGDSKLLNIPLRLLTQEEFNRIPEANGGDIYKFYKHLTKNYYPPGFVGLDFHDAGSCESEATLRLNAPDLRVRVVILENTSRDPIPLDSFYILENDEIKLRLEAEDRKANATPVAKKLFAEHTLAAGDKILIPLAIELVYRDGWREDASAKYVYRYGPSWDITDAKVGIEIFPFRKADPNLYVLLEGTSIFASCPFAYTYDDASGKWLLEDHFLYRKDHVAKRGYDTLALKRFTGELRIRETDPETSYIDLIEIHFQPDRGDVRILKPDLANLRHQDGRYLITNQGDAVSLIFDGYDKKAKGRYSLVSYGWYERYDDAPAPGTLVK